MNETAVSPPTGSRGRRPNYSTVTYRPRVAACLLIAAMLLSIAGGDLYRIQVGMAAFCLAWPHLAYWQAQRRGGGARAEKVNVMVDCLLGGALAAVFGLRLWPTTAVYAMGGVNLLLLGGPRLLATGLAVSALAFIPAMLLLDIDVHLDTEPLATALGIGAILSYIGLVATTAYRFQVRQREVRAALRREEKKSHELLLNVLPGSVIPRLQAGESPIADQYADVTVIFADIADFTPLSERLGPKAMVLLLNDLFRKFDHAATALGIEKIETTGDGYLAVAGAPGPLDEHPGAAARFAFAIVEAACSTLIAESEHVQVRVGVHTGPVFAGVIGESRFHYKIFGETVNVASRIQHQSHSGRVLVSETTYKRIKDKFHLEEHGSVELKGHGPMRTYWLVSQRRKGSLH